MTLLPNVTQSQNITSTLFEVCLKIFKKLKLLRILSLNTYFEFIINRN